VQRELDAADWLVSGPHPVQLVRLDSLTWFAALIGSVLLIAGVSL
jgi:hypothetical protein